MPQWFNLYLSHLNLGMPWSQPQCYQIFLGHPQMKSLEIHAMQHVTRCKRHVLLWRHWRQKPISVIASQCWGSCSDRASLLKLSLAKTLVSFHFSCPTQKKERNATGGRAVSCLSFILRFNFCNGKFFLQFRQAELQKTCILFIWQQKRDKILVHWLVHQHHGLFC